MGWGMRRRAERTEETDGSAERESTCRKNRETEQREIETVERKNKQGVCSQRFRERDR